MHSSGTYFYPNAPITREAAAYALCHAFHLMDTSVNPSNFKDYKQISSWAVQSVNALVDQRYLAGMSDGSFNPQSHLTRAEFITIIERLDASGHLTPKPSNDDTIITIPTNKHIYTGKISVLGQPVTDEKTEFHLDTIHKSDHFHHMTKNYGLSFDGSTCTFATDVFQPNEQLGTYFDTSEKVFLLPDTPIFVQTRFIKELIVPADGKQNVNFDINDRVLSQLILNIKGIDALPPYACFTFNFKVNNLNFGSSVTVTSLNIPNNLTVITQEPLYVWEKDSYYLSFPKPSIPITYTVSYKPDDEDFYYQGTFTLEGNYMADVEMKKMKKS